jgi:hypothetical protein
MTGRSLKLAFGLMSVFSVAVADELAVVRTPEEFVSAVLAGDAHIQIREHLDFRGAKPAANATDGEIIRPSAALKSVRVRFPLVA